VHEKPQSRYLLDVLEFAEIRCRAIWAETIREREMQVMAGEEPSKHENRREFRIATEENNHQKKKGEAPPSASPSLHRNCSKHSLVAGRRRRLRSFTWLSTLTVGAMPRPWTALSHVLMNLSTAAVRREDGIHL